MTYEDLEKALETRAAAEAALKTAKGADYDAYKGVINECDALIARHYMETIADVQRVDAHAFDSYKRAKGIKV